MVLERLKRLAQGWRSGPPEPPCRWRTPATLDRGGLGEACLALDGQGQGQVLWENAGEVWSRPIGSRSAPALARHAMGEGGTPRIALNRDGRGIALWQADVAGERQILARQLGGGESIAQVIFRTGGRVKHLQAAVDRRGNTLVVWLLERAGRLEVMALAFDTRAQAWEQEPRTLGLPSGPHAAPRVAVNHRQHAMVLWEAVDPAFEGLVASHYWPVDRIWSDRAVPVVPHATRQHQVGMDDMGNALALWVHAAPGQPSRLEASFYDVRDGEWGEPLTLGQAETFSNPRLLMSGDGPALAAWSQGEASGGPRLFARAFTRGAWGASVEYPEGGHGPVRDFAIGLGAGGQAGLIAIQRGTEGDRVSARLCAPDWSAPMVLAPAAGQPCASPRIAFGPQGASALWVQGEGPAAALILTETR